jgi:hypothetical protein
MNYPKSYLTAAPGADSLSSANDDPTGIARDSDALTQAHVEEACGPSFDGRWTGDDPEREGVLSMPNTGNVTVSRDTSMRSWIAKGR